MSISHNHQCTVSPTHNNTYDALLNLLTSPPWRKEEVILRFRCISLLSHIKVDPTRRIEIWGTESTDLTAQFSQRYLLYFYNKS